jgi:hypothetical protein
MLPEYYPSFSGIQDDTEIEWLLCLASALQARHQQTATPAVEGQPLPQVPPLES